MSSVKFELNINGLRELMKGAEMQGVLNQAGSKVAQIAQNMSGHKYGSRVHDASFVSICNVYPEDAEGRSDNYENNTAVKALSSSGLSMTK